MRNLAFTAVILLCACSRYEEGPDFSLQTKTKRISNNWRINTVYDNGADATMSFCESYPAYQLNIGTDEKYTISYTLSSTEMYVESGTWKFNNDKTHLILTSGTGVEYDFTILRLEKNDLRLKQVINGGGERKIHFWPKSNG